MNTFPFTTGRSETARQRTAWIEAGSTDGSLLVFEHGWPEAEKARQAAVAFILESVDEKIASALVQQ